MNLGKKFSDKFKKKSEEALNDNANTLEASELDNSENINPPSNDDSQDKLKNENEELKKKYEVALRMVAEKDNQLKNTIEMNKKDIQLVKDDYAKKFISEIASEFDNLFRMIDLVKKDLSQENNDSLSGIAKKFMEAFAKVGVTFTQPHVGELFDANMHNVITQVASPEFKTGEIVHVISSCWKIGEKVVKFADVIVAS